MADKKPAIASHSGFFINVFLVWINLEKERKFMIIFKETINNKSATKIFTNTILFNSKTLLLVKNMPKNKGVKKIMLRTQISVNNPVILYGFDFLMLVLYI